MVGLNILNEVTQVIKNYCLVGTGSRGLRMYAIPLVQDYQSVARLTGICDINPGRLEWAREQLGDDVQAFKEFDEMLDNVPCDTVIVTTKDSLHDEFIIKALKKGKDVITEKPMTINAEKCRAIIAAERETGKQVRVTFNARYVPYRTKIKEMLQSGVIGDVHSVDFHWYLDTVHGADYFRRWHRKKDNSGGLLVHKATHHFDLVNWWLGLNPVQVAAFGSRHYYVPERKPNHGTRCLTCGISNDCEFYLDTKEGDYQSLYFNHEQHDGYHRDQCVFSDDTDIEDTMSLIVRYEKNVQMSYSLTAATSFEGWRIAFNGSKGRLEAFEPEAFIVEGDKTRFEERSQSTVRRRVNWETSNLKAITEPSYQIRVYPLFGGATTLQVHHEEGEHGGSDRRLRDHLFLPDTPDPLNHVAGTHAGAMSILIGIAANISIAEQSFVRIDDLLKG